MVTVNAEIFPPANQEVNRTIFAFGLVKVKMNSGQTVLQRKDEVQVLGLVVMNDHQQPKPDEEQ